MQRWRGGIRRVVPAMPVQYGLHPSTLSVHPGVVVCSTSSATAMPPMRVALNAAVAVATAPPVLPLEDEQYVIVDVEGLSGDSGAGIDAVRWLARGTDSRLWLPLLPVCQVISVMIA